MDYRGMNCFLAVIAFLMLVEFSQTLSVLKARQVTDATNQQLVDPAITDPKAIQADKIMWYTQDPDQQDHIRLHWFVLVLASYFPSLSCVSCLESTRTNRHKTSPSSLFSASSLIHTWIML
jgi:hypothetical protein